MKNVIQLVFKKTTASPAPPPHNQRAIVIRTHTMYVLPEGHRGKFFMPKRD